MSPSGLKQAVADLVGFSPSQAAVEQAAGADEHEAIDQAHSGGIGDGAVYQDQAALVSISEVPGDRGGITRSAGDQRIERGAPGVHRGWDQVDVFDRRLSAGHGSVPHAATAGLRPSFTAIS